MLCGDSSAFRKKKWEIVLAYWFGILDKTTSVVALWMCSDLIDQDSEKRKETWDCQQAETKNIVSQGEE